MNEKVERFTRGFFWFGYAVFLAASIPHIAAYFRHFDPATSVWVEPDSFEATKNAPVRRSLLFPFHQ